MLQAEPFGALGEGMRDSLAVSFLVVIGSAVLVFRSFVPQGRDQARRFAGGGGDCLRAIQPCDDSRRRRGLARKQCGSRQTHGVWPCIHQRSVVAARRASRPLVGRARPAVPHTHRTGLAPAGRRTDVPRTDCRPGTRRCRPRCHGVTGYALPEKTVANVSIAGVHVPTVSGGAPCRCPTYTALKICERVTRAGWDRRSRLPGAVSSIRRSRPRWLGSPERMRRRIDRGRVSGIRRAERPPNRMRALS